MTNKDTDKIIDWKFFNYLKDKATEFEDNGCEIHIFVDAKLNHSNHVETIYCYSSTDGEEYYNNGETNLNLDNLSLLYDIILFNSDKIFNIKDYYMKIKKNCTIIGEDGDSIQIKSK